MVKKRFINKYLEYAPKFLCQKERCRREIGNVFLYYRICDQGYAKEKPPFITKENCLKNAISQFPIDKVCWMVIADNVCNDTYNMICKYVPESQIKRVSVGHGAGTFRIVYEEAIKNKDNDLIYFLEDDYLHLHDSYEALRKAAECNYGDYFTLYDHPDKYGYDSPNPLVVKGGERTRLYWCGNHHWKITNSTTMTFAAFADVLKKDKKVFWRWTEGRHPYDFQLFTELKLLRARLLLSAVPAMSTHGETCFLSYGTNWSNV